MRVREINNIKSLESFHLMAGQSGLGNIIKDAVIFEYENFSVAPDNYYEGDFVISTLIFAKEHPELIVPTLQRLMKQRISGLAIKSVYFETLPAAVKEYADENGLPVFLFQNTYIENIILSIHEYMRTKNNLTLYEKDFHEMLYGNLPERSISDKAAAIIPQHNEKLSCMYLRAGRDITSEPVFDILNFITKNKKFIDREFCFYQYRDGIFILHNLQSVDEEENLRKFRSLINRLEVMQTAIIMGMSSIHEPDTELDLCVKESYFACCYALYKNKSLQTYSSMGIYRFIFPIIIDKTGRSYYETLIGMINRHDLQNHTCLLSTLIEYVKADCDINTTAKQLFQHPNTIRYRLQKAYDLIGGADEQEMIHTLYIIALILNMKEPLFSESENIVL